MGSDTARIRLTGGSSYFNPRSPHGERLLRLLLPPGIMVFQSTLPAWGATTEVPAQDGSGYISIHAPRMGSDCFSRSFARLVRISIHAPRMGSDISPHTPMAEQGISIHAPRMGSDTLLMLRSLRQERFQSTLPAWGATANSGFMAAQQAKFQSTLPAWGATNDLVIIVHIVNFNPRSPHGERHPQSLDVWHLSQFQSTLPAWGATSIRITDASVNELFQSTLPAWGATRPPFSTSCVISNFNPRSPHGERQSKQFAANYALAFQSTLPAWGATGCARAL